MSSKRRLPIVVDLPTGDPRLGFESYVDVISRAILGGDPARFTVALYGDWGSGKSSLLKALKARLSPKASTEETAPEDDPILVDFDAWRYADKGAVALSMLLRIERAVELRSQTDRVSAKVRKGLTSTLSVIRQVIKSVQISAWGFNVGVQVPEATSTTDAETALQPFDQLSDIASHLPSGQRIVVLIDDLDRCTPEAVVDVVEAINVLTDITGIVFVLALDYRYLTGAIRQKYKNIDADQFIENIVQVPFHIPTPQIDHFEFSHVIQNWDEVKSFMDGVDERELKDILRFGLRSNPRQLKRLLNLYLITAEIASIKNEMRHTALKLLALRISWPRVFSALQKDLEAVKRIEHPSIPWVELKFDEFVSNQWRRNQQATERAELGNGNNVEPVCSSSNADREFRSDFDLADEAQEDLDEFINRLLLDGGEDVYASDVLAVMVVAQETTRELSDSEQNVGEVKEAKSRLQDTYDRAPRFLQAAYDRAKSMVPIGADDNSIETPSYFRFSRSSARRNTVVYAIMRIRPRIETLRVNVTLFKTTYEDLSVANLPSEFVRDAKEVENSPGDLTSNLVLGGFDDEELAEERLNSLRRILEFAYDRVGNDES